MAIDSSAALALPGVRAVLTGADVAAWSTPFAVGVKQPMEHWSLAIERARYVGEPVAVVMAESRYLAEDALELIKVEYASAAGGGRSRSRVGRRLRRCCTRQSAQSGQRPHFSYGEPDAAFADAARTVSVKVHYPRNSCTPIECFVVVAEYLSGDEGYDVMSNFMGPFSLQPVMARSLKVRGDRLRLRAPRDSGGSFGIKQAVSPVHRADVPRRAQGRRARQVDRRPPRAPAGTGRSTTTASPPSRRR